MNLDTLVEINYTSTVHSMCIRRRYCTCSAMHTTHCICRVNVYVFWCFHFIIIFFSSKGPNTRCNMLHAICCMQQNRSVCVRKVACCNCRSTVARNRTSFYSTRLVAPNIKGSSRRRCKKKMAAVWTVNKIEQFIDLYEQRPCLYNTKMKEYHDRDIRKKAMEEISGVLEVSVPTFHQVQLPSA